MPNPTARPEILNENQRRHLIASLARVEQALRQIVAMAGQQPAPERAGLAHAVNDLPARFGDRIGRPVADAMATLVELTSTLELDPPASSYLRSVQALVISSIVVVEDTVSRNLRGYGDIHPELPDLLDPLLARLHEQLLDIGRALPVQHQEHETGP